MSIPRKDKDAIKRLAKEGKQISKIYYNDFPEHDYWDIYNVVYDSGGRSARGAKTVISRRLNQMINARRKDKREEIIDEINDLVWHLYSSLKVSQKKLEGIREILSK